MDGAAAADASAAAPLTGSGEAPAIVRPPEGRRILLSVKLGMVPGVEDGEKTMPLADRLKIAAQAGFDGVDFERTFGFPQTPLAEAMARTFSGATA